MVTGNSGIAYQGRSQTGAASQHFGDTPGTTPAWLKLERRGNLVTALTSSDGYQWVRLGSATIALPTSAYIGLAVSSHSLSQPASALFGDVNVSSPMAPATVPVTAPATEPVTAVPTRVMFTPSVDHDALVERYVLHVLVSSDGGTVVAAQDLGKPAVVNGEISADIAATLQPLPGGSYVATVTAVGTGGISASESVPFTK